MDRGEFIRMGYTVELSEDDGKVTASQRHLSKAKSIIERHYPQGGAPSGLLTDIYKAVRGAEMFGFSDCLRYFTPSDCAEE